MIDKFAKAFLIAIRKGELVKVQKALAEGADPNGRDEYDLTPLIWAARKGHFQIFSALLKAGADLHARDITERTFLHHCVLFKRHDFLGKVLGVPGVPLDCTDKHGFTAIDVAIADANHRCVAPLKSAGAKPNIYPEYKIGSS